MREATLEKSEDVEEDCPAEEILERIGEGDKRTLNAEEIWRGLEN